MTSGARSSGSARMAFAVQHLTTLAAQSRSVDELKARARNKIGPLSHPERARPRSHLSPHPRPQRSGPTFLQRFEAGRRSQSVTAWIFYSLVAAKTHNLSTATFLPTTNSRFEPLIKIKWPRVLGASTNFRTQYCLCCDQLSCVGQASCQR